MKTSETGTSTSRVARRCTYTSLAGREQVHQIRGQHMFLYPKDQNIYRGHLKPFSDDELKRLKTRIDQLVNDEKYTTMAKLAEL